MWAVVWAVGWDLLMAAEWVDARVVLLVVGGCWVGGGGKWR